MDDLKAAWRPRCLSEGKPLETKALETLICLCFFNRLYNRRGRDVFTCRVIHSFPLRMSVIQILYRDEVVALSHLIGSESLPKPGQVCKTCPFSVFKRNILGI